MKRHTSRSMRRICRPDVTAFAGIMLVLLFTAVVTAPMESPYLGVGPDLPKVNHSVSMRGAAREDALIVTITRDGKVFFDGEQNTVAQLPARIGERLNRGAERKAYIRADTHASYAAIREVLESVRSAGVENVAFLVSE